MAREKRIAAIIVAAGRGTRASGSSNDTQPKQYRRIGGKAVLQHSIDALLAVEGLDPVLVVLHPDHTHFYAALGEQDPRVQSAFIGGAERRQSVLAGLKALAPQAPDCVLIHDAARPFVSAETIMNVINALADYPAVLPVVPVTDTIKRSLDGRTVQTTEDRNTLFAAQTPQGFRFPQLLSAHLRAERMPRPFTDDAAIMEWAGLPVGLVGGSSENTKLTLPQDFEAAERRLRGGRMETRIGSGFDVHAFTEGSSVWLGGVEIPHTHKLLGHSDADVALHALTDALYGAIGEGDIGTHFPPSDPRWKGTASKVFLIHAAELVRSRGGRIVNCDVTIICEAPRISPHVPTMRSAISHMLEIAEKRIAIKATTSEELGFPGRREGIIAMATASVELPQED
jgi:2-C-methyl-D-erythritol 4-phosphate cytidylyltransferase/2-C-methyl-D-erythritol 2,4-cyclodiphosphate synthase